jgi:NAD(P)-dependent dehydrogenase (short-subunit alcohol dehydrogenase family)
MKTKICLITGANAGIGKASAIAIAKKGYQIVMFCRNAEKAKKAQAEIAEFSSHPVDLFICDLASQKSIRDAAEAFKKKYKKLDVLLNNAGFIASSKTKTENGTESTFAVNHLGPFLLTNLLLPLLKETKGARVVNVSSEGHRYAKFEPDNLELERGYSNMKAYCLSKLCNIMFTHELAKITEQDDITTFSLHPGVVASNFSNNTSGLMGFAFSLIKPFMITNAKGAETSVYLATDPGVEKFNGKYFTKKTIKVPTKYAYDDLLTKQLWKISEKMTNL